MELMEVNQNNSNQLPSNFPAQFLTNPLKNKTMILDGVNPKFSQKLAKLQNSFLKVNTPTQMIYLTTFWMTWKLKKALFRPNNNVHKPPTNRFGQPAGKSQEVEVVTLMIS